MTASFRLVPADSINPAESEAFFKKAFGELKGDFLTNHRTWHYHDSPEQYFALSEDDSLAGFYALIQSQCLLEGTVHDCFWFVDLIVLPEFRRQGLQHMMDAAVRALEQLRFGFPNELAAPIHRKHGWGVRYEVLKQTLPLSMRVSDRVRFSPKITGKIARVISSIASPLYGSFFRLRYGNYKAKFTERLTSPDFERLATVYESYQRQLNLLTTHRSQQILEWRYGDAPYELQYYLASKDNTPQLVVITRFLEHKHLKTLRIMDIFGAIEDTALLNDAIQTILRDASHARVEQVQLISTVPAIQQAVRDSAFWTEQSAQFCWYSQDEGMMATIDSALSHFVFADSDFDAP